MAEDEYAPRCGPARHTTGRRNAICIRRRSVARPSCGPQTILRALLRECLQASFSGIPIKKHRAASKRLTSAVPPAADRTAGNPGDRQRPPTKAPAAVPSPAPAPPCPPAATARSATQNGIPPSLPIPTALLVPFACPRMILEGPTSEQVRAACQETARFGQTCSLGDMRTSPKFVADTLAMAVSQAVCRNRAKHPQGSEGDSGRPTHAKYAQTTLVQVCARRSVEAVALL